MEELGRGELAGPVPLPRLRAFVGFLQVTPEETGPVEGTAGLSCPFSVGAGYAVRRTMGDGERKPLWAS